ncbi:hypothetical protein IMZ48_13400, partial [Candidatus Bathyarchaeota archaeon]|nr:hypothetical protein [Candidatus Bathyarchaeota archaeon]
MSRPGGSPESIIVWTPEERRYLRRLLNHDFLTSTDEIRRVLTNRRLNGAPASIKKKPVGEFRILVVGARGAGKTSLLTRVSESPRPPTSRKEAHPTRDES